MRSARYILLFAMAATTGCSTGNGGGDACGADEDCPAGFYCRAEECVYDCTGDRDCPSGWTCTARGRCEEGCKISNGGVEICDGVDNDCDDTTDEGLLNRCGECEPPDDELFELCGDATDNDCDGETDEGFDLLGTPCENLGCHGEWACSADGLTEVCPVGPPEEDDATCDGIDEDCDGETDEDAEPQPCELTLGVCAGVMRTCVGPGEWSPCEYGPAYTQGQDNTCDILDNDCDGETDEDAEPLLEGEADTADGLDENCNGIADEPGGAMLPLQAYPGVYADVYEIGVYENPDCSGQHFGTTSDDYPAAWPAEGLNTVTLYACSIGGILPSGHLSWYRAKWACEAQGKRLCGALERTNACGGNTGRFYPYGSDFRPGMCNDAWQADGANTMSLAASGSYEECVSVDGFYDISGNLAEWVAEWDPEYPQNAWIAGGGYYCELCWHGIGCGDCTIGDTDDFDDIDNMNDCRTAVDKSYESFLRNDARFYFGTRCCYDVP